MKSPWFHVGIDLIGPINPTSNAGNRYILTISDYFSKFVDAMPLPDKSGSGVVKNLRKVLSAVSIVTTVIHIAFVYYCMGT